jgi:hypothetical protein
MSMFAKFSLQKLIIDNSDYLGIKSCNVRLSDGTDSITEAQCPAIVIDQMPDIGVGDYEGYDLFTIQLFHKKKAFDLDEEIIFSKLASLFKDRNAVAVYAYDGIDRKDYFEYQNGSEDKSGIQTGGNKLRYKQFAVAAPKTNARR